jgi:isoleucyl-tRNA synthetase
VQWPLKKGGKQHVAWRVVPADFVTTDTGTGIVHQAPAFGEVDFDVLIAERDRFVMGSGLELICSVAPDGKFTSETPEFEGRWVKDADKDICRDMRARGILFHQEQYLHDYPFCWRADEDPLIQYPRKSWFIRTTQFKEKMLANNARINWLPEHIRDGRFGNFLETNVDWALSRERYWGTPLPIWVCDQTGYTEAVANYEELLAKPGISGTEVWQRAKAAKPDLPDYLKVHKPYIDAITYDSPKAPGARMRRVSEVIDCWFDSGAMPVAQWGFPASGGSAERFADQFPADFISEALDQTRGWFYSLLAISTLMFSEEADGTRCVPATLSIPYPHPFRNCIVLGLMLTEWWESPDGKQRFLAEEEARDACGEKAVRRVGKMSKSLRNYPPPQRIFDTHGADALRWFFFAGQPPWNSIIYSDRAIKESIPEFLLTLWNCYSFFVIYANIDRFDPGAAIPGDPGQLGPDVLATADGFRPVAQRAQIDRWILSELHRAAAAVTERMDAYDNFGACVRLTGFVDALSNWYVRRCRDRFWSGDDSADKRDAYWTLYECLLTACKLIAPFVPFLAEEMWQNLAVAATGGRSVESVHLCDYPTGDPAEIDELLSDRMDLAREIVSLGRSARMNANLKVRQPLALVEVILVHEEHVEWLKQHEAIASSELNVKRIEFAEKAQQYITYTVLPDLKRLGPRLGKRLPALRKALAGADGGVLLAEMEAAGKIVVALPDGPVELDRDDIQIRLQAKEGWAAAQGRRSVVVLSTELTPDLINEGLAREIVRLIQDRRKEMDCRFTDRIAVGVVTDSEELTAAIGQFTDYIQGETLAVELRIGPIDGAEPVQRKAGAYDLVLYIRVAG